LVGPLINLGDLGIPPEAKIKFYHGAAELNGKGRNQRYG
jgi:hypothetical protein